jgi:hypothetical protein
MKYFIALSLLFVASISKARITSTDTLATDTTKVKKRTLLKTAQATSFSSGSDFSEALKTYIPKNIQGSPEVAAFQAMGHVPVGHYTGKPNISIPIYTIEGDGIRIPVSINYDASGIKVEQEATQVGLGWSLNAGGMISRQMRGRDDFIGILRTNNTDQTAMNRYINNNYLIAPAPNNTGNVTWQFTNTNVTEPMVLLSTILTSFFSTCENLLSEINPL